VAVTKIHLWIFTARVLTIVAVVIAVVFAVLCIILLIVIVKMKGSIVWSCNVLARVSIPLLLYTVSQKKVPTFKLSVTLSNLNRFSNFYTAEKRTTFATKPHDITHLTLDMLLHYLGKLKIQIFCRYSPDMEENAIQSVHITAFVHW